MNRLFLINDIDYVVGFDYYDAITKYKEYKENYDETIVQKIELVCDKVIHKAVSITDKPSTDKPNRICDICGEEGGTTKYRPDPYVEEIHDKTVYKNICDSCHQVLLEDI